MNDKLLSSLGLASREIKIYKAVVRVGAVAPAELGKLTGIKRTTAYSIARGLVEKGLLVENATKRPRVFTPASPKDIREVFASEKERLHAREGVYAQLAEELAKAEARKTYPVPQIRFVEAEKMEQFIIRESAKWDTSMLKSDSVWWGFQDHTYAEQFPKAITAYWRQAPKEISLKLLSNQSDVEVKMRGKHTRREIKFWNKSGHFVSTLWVVGEYVVTVNTSRHPYYLVEMHDALLAQNLREMFKVLWASA